MSQPSLFGDDLPEKARPKTSRAASETPVPRPEQPSHEPLASRMRPRTLDEIIGQQHLLGPGRLLRSVIEKDRLSSMIFWGPPGSGKTTLAEVIAAHTKSRFVALSAVTAGVADMRKVVEETLKLKQFSNQRTLLFIDEIHRFNKSQQDFILPHTEKGTFTLIGATTENPSFEVNSALLSRARVFVLHALGEEDLMLILRRAVEDPVRGLGNLGVSVPNEVLEALSVFANGDARMALNALELAAQGAVSQGTSEVTLALMEEVLQQRTFLYDKDGEQHYDMISALHKSLRGSDPDAAIYWMTRMLEGGEEPLFIARRLVRFASEDVGMADPQALVICMAAQQAVHFIGMPEAALALVQATVYLATAPKSRAVDEAYLAAVSEIRQHRNEPVPLHLRNAPTRLMKELGYGAGRINPAELARSSASEDPARPHLERLQPYLPDRLRDTRFYHPYPQGNELSIKDWLEKRRRLQDEAASEEA